MTPVTTALSAILPLLEESVGMRADQHRRSGILLEARVTLTARERHSISLSLMLLSLGLLAAACNKASITGPDFSKTNVVAAVFDGTNVDFELGLNHIEWERDGRTTPAVMESIPCRHLKVMEFNPGYLYFTIHPTFKRRSVKNVTIEVEFFDQGLGRLGLQYDASKTVRQPNAAYTYLDEIQALSDSRLWCTASFRVPNATFQGAQNSGADFRLWVSPPDLYVRRVTVTRGR